MSAAVGATTKRSEKTAALASLLRELGPGEVGPVVAWLSGELTQRQIGVGWRTLRDAAPAAEAASLTVGEVEAAFTALGSLSGAGSVAARRDGVAALFSRATAAEQRFLVALMTGELRQGALAGLLADAVAKAAGVAAAEFKRALTLHGSLAEIAALALGGGSAALATVRLQVGRPLSPMLAATAADTAAAFARVGGEAFVDWKVDGARVQVHRSGDEVRVFTRTLDDVTARLPEVVAFASALPCTSVVLDAEAIALREDGRPEPFQVTASRFGSAGAREVPLTVLAFDVLHVDGVDVLDEPLRDRSARLLALAGPSACVPRSLCADAACGQAVFDAAVAAGYEGVVVKAPDDPYAAGRRASGWLKVKPVHTFDLVVLGAEWGHGRRRGKLSNLWLGARDGDGFAMVGKTFKGLTDELLAWQTERLLALERGREGIAVLVEPSLVVEVAIDGVQTSSRYAGGAALRFARVKRYREDKPASEADTLATLLALRDR